MATLEYTKTWGLQEKTATLLDLSRTRLNSPTPHQAPQRERCSMAALPLSSQEERKGRRRKHRKWGELLRPDYNMGVPQLMMILEPNIVWDHTHGTALTGKEVEAQYCPGDFFDGWHKGGRPAHGVYEGRYWELIGDCEEMMEMLKKMAQAPPLEEEPPLELPDHADLPKWEDFKPVLQVLPSAPTLAPLRLPPFRAPILDTELPFIEPEYVPLPDVADAAQEEALPHFFPPEELKVDPFYEPEFVTPEPPVIPEAPHAPAIGRPQYGHDWSGTRPFTVDMPVYQAPKLLDVPTWLHPPRGLPKLPVSQDLLLDVADADLEPLPRLELAWECGPDPEPLYASTATTPRTISRAPSPPRSRPVSAGPSASWHSPSPPSTRPVSAVPEPLKEVTPAATPPRPSTAGSSRGPPTSRPPSAAPPSPSPPREPSPPPREPSPPPLPSAPSTRPVSAVHTPALGPAAPEQEAWDAVSDVDAGKPRVWLNFEKPFSELPPIFMPPYPEKGTANGPEPRLEDFPIDGELERLPDFLEPQEKPLPVWEMPALKAPRWVPPSEPRPIGFMRGTAPVLIIDVSGTMNPRQRGKFPDMKGCVCELLAATGELATAAGAFDVIAFCNAAWAWSATYSQRLSLLASAQVFYSGRQVGGKIVHGSRVAEKTKAGAQLMPTEPELLEDARNWVDKWPDAVGHTSLLSSFLMADDHWNADCWYIFSDGLADDPQQCLDFIDTRIRHDQRTPVIHTVGFFPEDTPEKFEGRRYLKQLSAITGGTFQEYDPKLARIYQDGVGFVAFDPKAEAVADREEREWAEEQLRAERKKNIRLGIAEALDVTLARVQALHHQTRVQPIVKEHADRVAQEQALFEAKLAEVQDYNANLAVRAREEHEAAVAEVTARNQAKLDGAKAAWEAAHAAWEESFDVAVREWEEMKSGLEKEREEAMAQYAALQASRSRTPSPMGSRPVSARPTSATRIPGASRPTSARTGLPPTSGSRPTSATPARSRPTSAVPAAMARSGSTHSAAAVRSGSGSSPSRPASAMPLLEGPAPDVTSGAAMAALALAAGSAWGADVPSPAHAMSSDGIVTAPLHPQGSSGSPSLSRPTSGRPVSGSARPLSASQRAPSAGMHAQAGDTSLQQLLEEVGEGEEEAVLVEGEPSGLSLHDDAVHRDEAYDSFALDGGDEPPPLELVGEDSQELKRKIFPPEIVAALDAANAARLDEIRGEWGRLLADVEARNARKLEALKRNQASIDKYAADVLAVYGESFVRDAIMGGAVRIAANDRIVKAAEAAFEAECEKVRKENERIAALHVREVEDKLAREESYRMAVERWESNKKASWAKHEADVVAAKEAHKENCSRLLAEWTAYKAEVDEMNAVRLSEAEALHARLVEEVTALNKRYRAEHAEKVKARKAVEAENLARQAEARAAHKGKLDALAIENEARLVEAQEDHAALCARLAVEHEEAGKIATKEFEELRGFLASHNEALVEEARRKHAEAVAAAQVEFEEKCATLRAVHEEELARVRAHNDAIWPQVQIARLALAELGRVQAFADHIRFCANKMALGVNYMPNTPCYDRVVEMQALNEALLKAFPDYPDPSTYPWPDWERKFTPGTGWVASPKPRALDVRDPAIDIIKIAAGRATSSTGGSRPASARPLSASQQGPLLPPPAGAMTETQLLRPSTAPPARPLSAGRARFGSLVTAAPGSPAGTSPRPTSAVPSRPGTSGSGMRPASPASPPSPTAAPGDDYASGGFTIGSRPGTATGGRPVSGVLAATAPVSLAASPRPMSARPQMRALSAGPTIISNMLSAPSMADPTNRPVSGRVLEAKGAGPATNVGSRGNSARPVSARPAVPARMAADLQRIQAAVAKYKSPKMFGVQQGVQGSAFRADFPKLAYPAVDVRALDL